MNYRISDDAESDLLEIWEYTTKTWSEVQADLYIDALIVRFAWLTQNRGVWISRPEIGANLYSYLEQSHVIIFRKGAVKQKYLAFSTNNSHICQ